MHLKEITDYLAQVAPLSFQESYDNSGLIVGDPNQKVVKGIISLDCTEQVVDEAFSTGANLIISHHPIVFSGLKKFTGSTYIERVVMKAIKHNIAIYAIHTNLDNVLHGVNKAIADRIGLENCQILSPKKQTLRKLITYCPNDHLGVIRDALFAVGAGQIGNYSECSFASNGEGTFKAGPNAKPFIGKLDERHFEQESKLEVIYPIHLEGKLIQTLKQIHPYEEVAYDLMNIVNSNEEVGSGLIGELNHPINLNEALALLKEKFNLKVIRHTQDLNKAIKKIAVCGGSGSFLLNDAINQNADLFISADYKYHQFFDSEGKIVIADIGHYESEQFTMDLLLEIIQNKFPTFALSLTKINTNPVFYY